MLGVMLGEAVVTRDLRRILRTGCGLALLTGGAGYALHAWGLHSGIPWLPFNKPDVSASYALFTSALATVVFLILYLIVDVRRLRRQSLR